MQGAGNLEIPRYNASQTRLTYCVENDEEKKFHSAKVKPPIKNAINSLESIFKISNRYLIFVDFGAYLLHFS